MAHGGKRVGAGRKKGGLASHTLEAAKAKARIVELVNQNIDKIILPLIAKAMDGDVPAAKEVMDRAYGKAAQAVSLTDGEGNAVQLQAINVIPIIAARSDS